MNGPVAAPPEQVRIWQSPGLPGLQMMQATYVTTTFARHTHEGFGVGVIERGALGFYYRGENVVAPEGRINLVNPDEVHTGQSATEAGWSYRMFYFGAELLQRAASELAGRPADLPFFASGVLDDPELAALVRTTHRRLEDGTVPLLERQSLFLYLLTRLVARHADAPPTERPVGREHRGVRRAMGYIAGNFGDEISVDELAAVAGLSPYHFIRVFCRATGLPPHAWLMQYRARMAQAMLRRGIPIADAACRAGFADQSHLNRVFKRLFGYPPGQYSNSVQDA
jgi:AraC-like DNA-binding protein